MAKFRMAVSYRNRECMLRRPPLPEWLRKIQDGYGIETTTSKYWLKIYWATPPWLNEEQEKEMKAIHDSANEGEHVDHIVPLLHPLVCGLHVPWNLQKLPGKINLLKSNNVWPDMPEYIEDMFGDRWNGDYNALPLQVQEEGAGAIAVQKDMRATR